MESILTRLPDDQARAYYDLLRRRLRRVLVMRALAIASLFCIFYTLRALAGGVGSPDRALPRRRHVALHVNAAGVGPWRLRRQPLLRLVDRRRYGA